jgi:RES domain-containing protein
MIHRPELLDALQSAPAGPLETTAWRHMFGTHPPDLENTGGARWNPPGVAAIYLSLARHGAIAEGDHAIAVQPLRPRARRIVYPVELTLGKVIDLSEATLLERVGLTDDDLASDDHTACQEVGAAIDWLEYDGLLVLSARSDALNLVIYPAHRSPDAMFSSGDGEELPT